MSTEPAWSDLVVEASKYIGSDPVFEMPGPTRIAGMNRRFWKWNKNGARCDLIIDCHDKWQSDRDFRWEVRVTHDSGTYTLCRTGCPMLEEVRALLQLIDMVPPLMAPLPASVENLLQLIEHWRAAKFAIPLKVLEAVDQIKEELQQAATLP